MEQLSSLEEKIGYEFNNRELLITALTHSSYSRESGSSCNERLEFLGDAFFDAIIGERLYMDFPDKEEGFLSKTRASVVREESLAEIAGQLELGQYMLLGRGEEKNGGRTRRSILADCMEAIIGAVYIDGGFGASREMVLKLFAKSIEDAEAGRLHVGDYKSRLQEYLNKTGIMSIRYVSESEEGPEHDKVFTVSLQVEGEKIARGSGKTKKQAEQQAACEALTRKYNVI